MFGKLYIYDASTPEDRDQAKARVMEDPSMRVLGVSSKRELISALDMLVAEKAYFSRVLVQTHGAPGMIEFAGNSIWDTTLKSDFSTRNYHRLFPLYTRIYFDGCNVAGGSLGTDFLAAVGSIFLRAMGGEVYGWTSYGYGMSSWIPFIGGHTVHFSGYVKRLYFKSGGIQLAPPAPPPERVWKGTRF